MNGGSASESDPALRAIRGARAELDALRRGGSEPSETRGYLLRVANAIDRSLRRLLRDDETADLSLRLRALAPDELRSDEVLAELRRNERLSVPLAAALHEVFEIRRRLERGASTEEDDARRAIHAAERLERDLERPPRRAPSPAAPPEPMLDPEIHPVPGRRNSRRRPPFRVWALAAAAIILLLFGGLFLLDARRGPNHLNQGIALFRSGAFAEAAHHFWRYAEANPRDATPHLYLARIHRRMDRLDLAADALREAQRLAPEDPAVHRELGFFLLDSGRSEAAVDRFRHALDLEAGSSEGWIGLIRALQESGRTAEVDRVLTEAPAEVRALLDRPPAQIPAPSAPPP